MVIRGRKAFTWSAILTIVLGLFVLIALALGPGRVTYEFAKEKFFGEKGLFAKPPRGDFVPWTGPELTQDDILALDSMAALQCAASGTAAGAILLGDGTANDAVCPQNREGGHAREVRSGSVCYGGACASCRGIKQRTITLPGDAQENAVRLANTMLTCMQHAKLGKLATQTGEYFNCAVIDPSDLRETLTYAQVKEKLAERDSEGTVGGSIEWDSDILPDPSKRYCVYYDKDWGSWDDIAVGECAADIRGSFECTVTNFQLPQQIEYGAESLLYPPAWLAGYGDPRYLAYYESLPPEAADAWHTDAIDLGAYLIIGSGLLNMIGAPGGAKAIKEAAKEGAQKGFLTVAKSQLKAALGAMKHGIKEVAERLSRIGERNLLRTVILEDALRQGGRMATNELDDVFLAGVDRALSKNIQSMSRQELEKFYLENVFKAVDDAALEALDDPSKYPGMQKLRQDVAKDLGLDAAESRAKGQAAARLNEQYKEAFIDAFTRDATGQGVRVILKDASRKAFFTQLITATGTDAVSYAINREATDLAIKRGIASLAHKAPEAAAAAVRNADGALQRMLQGAYRGTFGDAPLTDPVRFLANQIPFTYEGVTSVRAFAGNNFNKMGSWVRDHKYPIMLLLMIAADDFDKANEKYKSVGVNSLALFTPTGIGEPVQYPLHPAAFPYYMQVEGAELQRLHSVSPCSATLVLREKHCACKRDPLAWHFNFGGGLSDVKPGTIGISDVLLEQEFNRIFDRKLAEKAWERHPEWAQTKAGGMSIAQFKKNRLADYRRAVEGYRTHIIQGPGLQGTDVGYFSSTQAQDYTREEHMGVWDFSSAERYCSQASTFLGSETLSNFGSAYYSNIVSFWNDDLGKNTYAQPKYTIDCISVAVERAETQGPNYCVNKCTGCTAARGVLLAVSLAIDLAVTGLTGGLGAPVALFLTGAGSAWAETIIADYEKWPGDGKWGVYKDFLQRLYE